jgi:tRNA(Ile)-lysidine synthase
VLHRLIRGTGLQGLRGIAAERTGGAVRVVRPLLTVTRAEVVEYLASLHQPHREDRTNADVAFTRNRIRRDLLPLLKTFNPQAVPVLGRLAEQAAVTFARLDALAETLRGTAEKPRAGPVLVFDIAPLAAADPAAAADLFRLVWHREGWPADGLTAAHWRRLADLTVGDYPGGVRLDRAGAVVRLGPRL